MKVKKYLFALGMLCISAIIFQILTFISRDMNFESLDPYNGSLWIVFIAVGFLYRLVNDTPKNKIIYESFILIITIAAFFAFTTPNPLDYEPPFLKKMFVYGEANGMDNDLLFFKIILVWQLPYIAADILRNIKKLKMVQSEKNGTE